MTTMGQHYSNPKRANDPHALPDVDTFYNYGPNSHLWNGDVGTAEGWYWQEVGTRFNIDGSCHPDCGPIVLDAYDIRGKAPLLDERGQHAHEDPQDGRCWHESWCEPEGPFDTEQEAVEDAQSGSDDNSDYNDDSDDSDQDEQDDEPGEEDYYLSDDERSIIYLGKRIVGPVDVDADPCPRDAVMRELATYITKTHYYPNVWAISDHGNATLISVMTCGCYFTEHGGLAMFHDEAMQNGGDGGE